MYVNDEMRLCYGTMNDEICRKCVNWSMEHCHKSNGRKKCPAWGTACGKFEKKPDQDPPGL